MLSEVGFGPLCIVFILLAKIRVDFLLKTLIFGCFEGQIL